MLSKYSNFKLVLLLCLIVIPSLAFAFTPPIELSVDLPPKTHEYYVDLDAGSNGNGTEGSPWNNIEAADGNVETPAWIYVKGTGPGTYWSQSGSENNEIVITAWGNETATFTAINGYEESFRIFGEYVILDGKSFTSPQLVIVGAAGKRTVHIGYDHGACGAHATIYRCEIKSGSSAIMNDGEYLGVYNCKIHDTTSHSIYFRHGDHCEFRNNIIWNAGGSAIQSNPHGTGEYIKEGIVSGNAIYSCERGLTVLSGTGAGGKIHGLLIQNNLIWFCDEEAIKFTGDNNYVGVITDVKVYNNTLYGSVTNQHGDDPSRPATARFTDNILTGSIGGDGTWVESNNNVIGSTSMFESTDASNADFLRLKPNDNTCIDQGYNTSSVITNDYFGNARTPIIDVGANEHVSGAEDTSPPTTPTNLQANAVSSSRIDLSWNASTDDVGVSGYNIYGDGAPTPIVSTSNTSYSDTGLSPETTYTYTVTAYDAAENESSHSTSVQETTQASQTLNIITVTPSDDYAKIESAQAGDLVEIAPGTYRFRVYLQNHGTADNPIIIRAQNPNNRPVWDLSGDSCEYWPGSYTGGDAGRGAWQIAGSYYQISGIIFKNAQITEGDGVGNSSGIRQKGSSNITVSNCHFEGNDNGVSGYGEDILYENCVMTANGSIGTGDLGHNIYTHGGTQTFRYCHIYDATEGQNLHMRGKTFRFEYCWIENEHTYMGDLMTAANDWIEGVGLVSEMTLIGCVIVGADNPSNDTKLFTMSNQPARDNVSMQINMYYNTIIGNGGNAAIVRFTNNGLASAKAYLYNNIFYGNHKPFTFDTTNGVGAVFQNNWWPSGYDYSAYSAYMSDSIFGTDPGFVDLPSRDYTLTAPAQSAGQANASLGEVPTYECYFDVNGDIQSRQRSGVNDLGAFEVGIPSPPPRDVTNQHRISLVGNSLTLGWTNPTSRDGNGDLIPENQDFQGVLIQYNVGADAPYPATHNNGESFGDEPGNLDEDDSFTGAITLGQVYKFSFFSHDAEGHFSSTAHLTVDTTSANSSPTINSFTGVPSSLNNPGESTTFNVSATDPDGDSLTYTINFGDGTANGSGSQVVHTYAEQGTYTATATVNDGNGNIVGESLQVPVNDIRPVEPKNVSAN